MSKVKSEDTKVKAEKKIKSEDTKDVKIKIEDSGPTLNDLRENDDQTFTDVIHDLSINEFYTKQDEKQKYNKFVSAVVPEENFNYMSDLIEMPMTKSGYKWILNVIDLATNEFDIEPLKNKEAKTTMEGFKKIVKRGILTLPEISLKTDGGTEFKGAFNSYLEDHGIMHKTAKAYRKQQLGPIEGLNTTVARLLMNYLNDKSVELDEDYYDWTDLLDLVREEVNSYRKRNMKKLKLYQNKRFFDPEKAGEPEFEIGQYVHYKMERPTDIHGHAINDSKFRAGDRMFSIETRKIDDILYYPSAPWYRYKLHDMINVSYSAAELKLSDQVGDFYTIKKIIDKTVEDGVTWYGVWYQGELRKDASWVEAKTLLEDGCKDAIDEYEESIAEEQAKAKKVVKKK